MRQIKTVSRKGQWYSFMKLSSLLLKEEIVQLIGNDTEIRKICYDSRKVKPGDVFVCIPGYSADGHEYAQKAEQAGAAAIVCEHDVPVSVPRAIVKNARRMLAYMAVCYYGRPSDKFNLIGVTGTNGKTSTTYMLKSIFEEAGFKVGLIGTNQNMIGDKIIHSDHTTPESLDLQELFAKMAKEKVDYVVMEVSSHSLELDRVAFCNFKFAIFTNLTQDHLDFHGTMDHYVRAKAKLFQMCKVGIINEDDPHYDELMCGAGCSVIGYGLERGSDVKAKNIYMNHNGVSFECELPIGDIKFTSPIPGRFTIYNMLGAIAACFYAGVNVRHIKEGLSHIEGVKGRIETVPTGREFNIIIDYAHTPDGVYNIVSTVREFAPGRVVTLFGCGGDRDRKKRPIMGKIAGELSDFLIVTSDNPRTENPSKIIEDIMSGVQETKCPYIIIENRKDAIRYAIEHAQKDDTIILAGKGHETYQILNTGKIHFDEREVVRDILNEQIS